MRPRKEDRNKRNIVGFVKRHKDELVLDGFEVVRLIGWEDVPDEDYYWKLRRPRMVQNILLSSCVGGLIPLKGSLTPNEYTYLDRFFKRNEYDEKGNRLHGNL